MCLVGGGGGFGFRFFMKILLLKIFCLAQNDKKFLRKNFFSGTIYCEYMACIDMNENIVKRKFLTQNL